MHKQLNPTTMKRSLTKVEVEIFKQFQDIFLDKLSSVLFDGSCSINKEAPIPYNPYDYSNILYKDTMGEMSVGDGLIVLDVIKVLDDECEYDDLEDWEIVDVIRIFNKITLN